MGYVANILLALATLAAPELGWGINTTHPALLPFLLLVPHALGLLTRRVLLSGRFRAGSLLERLLSISPALLQALAVCVLGWTHSLEAWTGWSLDLSGWPGIEVLAGLAPFVVLEILAIDARIRLLDEPREAHRSVRAFHVRLFLSALLPFVVYLSLASLVGLYEPLRVYVQEVALVGAAFTLVLIVLFVRFLPWLLRCTWSTTPLQPGGLRAMLDELARAARFRCRDIFVWRTADQMANAAIVGFTPRSRIVLFSDALLAHLAPREIAAVFAHEMGHARRHHAATFASFALVAFLGADLLLTNLKIDDETIALAVFGAVLALWYFAFGMLSRRFELEADLSCLELLGEGDSLIHALDKVTGAHAHERSSWRHFSTAQRIRFMREVERDPEVGRRLSRRLRLWSRSAFVVLAIVGALQLRELVGSWGPDRVVAALRLGRYERATDLAEGTELDEHLAELVAVAGAFDGRAPTPAELETDALAALESGDDVRARDLVELALARGRRDLGPVLDVLDARVAGEPAVAPPADLPERWRAALGVADGPLR